MKKLYKLYWSIKLALFEHLLPFCESADSYMKLQTRFGIIHPSGAPKHCRKCGHDKFERGETWREDYLVVEYQVFCGNCKTVNGHWAYGNWSI